MVRKLCVIIALALPGGAAIGQASPELSFGNIQPAPKPVQPTPMEWCGTVADYAAKTMEMRQMGMALYEVAESVKADMASGQYSFLTQNTAELLVTRTFATEMAPTERLAIVAVSDFRDNVFYWCMDAIPEK